MSDNKTLTMKDMARALGVSVATVSRALSNSPSISAEVREKIQQYAQENNFTPNVLASRLRQTNVKHSKVIGVIVPEFVHYYFSTILSGIEEEASSHGYTLLVAQSNESYEREVEICQNFLENRVCGVIVSQAKDTVKYEHFRNLIEAGCPLVFYDRICTGINASRVVVDDYDGAFNAVSHLIETGCRRIAFLGSRPNMEITKNRYNGYADALLHAKIPIDNSLVINCDNGDMATELVPRLYDPVPVIYSPSKTRGGQGALTTVPVPVDVPVGAPPSPDAFFCINDETAVSVVHALKRLGLSIPKDVSVCGFANDNLSRACDPLLTTVEQRGREVGRLATEILITSLDNPQVSQHPIKRIVRTKLIIRGTTKDNIQ